MSPKVWMLPEDVYKASVGTYCLCLLLNVPPPSGLSDLCVLIKPDGREQWIEHAGVVDYTRMAKPDLLAMISEAGIPGLQSDNRGPF